MRGLLVHEWIEAVGGAERVVDAFADAYPAADVFGLWNDAPGRYADRRVVESVLARSPLRGRKALSMPFLPALWSHGLRTVGEYDWAIVSSHLFAHQARVTGVAPDRQFTYVHTPARYLWNPELDARGSTMLARAGSPVLRSVDRRRAQGLRHVAANSRFVQQRIRDTWGIDAQVINPPVGVERLAAVADWASVLDERDRAVLEALPADFVLGASRFVPYKRLDVVIDAGRASGRPVVLAGDGPDAERLRALAAESRVEVHFVCTPSDAMLAALLQRAAVYVFPPVEDFGILPVEALALGTPVVANAEGGARDSVQEGTSGTLLHDLADSTLAAAVDGAVRLDPAACRARAAAFSTERFQREIAEWTGIPVGGQTG
ncbi:MULTISPECIES: glycosyltransferase [unclassified Curtobacterium]|uniref:glycosyltransferase n=2 Tax=Bacteria TaxID=2 RepID=UPI00104C0EDF|nr:MULTISPECIES: glycosyltransferase [unclassified Curtobacterium]TCL76720.1 glycosyltransferase involved in cell wall biosynthesis [Curtobacterium sp. PhB128]TCL91339.1 glycosyltransferase involved in cell wall biosynthesis [Curtobacterium sp. PhB138]